MNYAILKEESVLPRQEGNAMAAAAGGGLTEWAERSALRRAGRMMAGGPAPVRLRSVFYGRVSTEDWQDPVTSRARQREQAGRWSAATGRSWRSSSTWGRPGSWRGHAARSPPPWSPGLLTRSGGGKRS